MRSLSLSDAGRVALTPSSDTHREGKNQPPADANGRMTHLTQIPIAQEVATDRFDEPPRQLRPVSTSIGSIDRPRAERAARELLEALGVDVATESTVETPRRMVDVYAELLTPTKFSPTTFPNDGSYDELVVARAIPFHSLCEHHLLPFVGVAHIGYLPGEQIVGLSKLARVVELYARSLPGPGAADDPDRRLARA